VAVFRSERLS